MLLGSRGCARASVVAWLLTEIAVMHLQGAWLSLSSSSKAGSVVLLGSTHRTEQESVYSRLAAIRTTARLD